MKKQHLIIILLFSFLLAVPAVQAQKKVLPAELEVELKYGADRLGKRQDPAMQKFRENRLGAFIHWGLYALPGREWKNKKNEGRKGLSFYRVKHKIRLSAQAGF